MKFNEKPSQEQLKKLQNQLQQNPEPGIQDIWVCMNPLYLLAEEDGVPIGVASISVGNEACELYKLYVAPSHKRKGVGTALVNKTIEILRKNNRSELFIEIAGESHPFWVGISEKHRCKFYSYEKFGIQIESH